MKTAEYIKGLLISYPSLLLNKKYIKPSIAITQISGKISKGNPIPKNQVKKTIAGLVRILTSATINRLFPLILKE
ncbi:MAG: hypothetical protein IJ195_00205 [Lachnospiraceae bacterium]|nr:hypothetical protein [Lachnospiraceae bacterium]